MKKLLITMLFLMMMLPFAAFAENDLEKQEFQTKVKNTVLEDLMKEFKSIEEFNQFGVLFWDGDVLTVGFKDVKLEENEAVGLLKNRMSESENPNIKIIEVKYTTQDLTDLMKPVEEEYLKTGDLENLISIGVREDLQKVELSVNNILPETETMLYDKFGDVLLITNNENLKKAELQSPQTNNGPVKQYSDVRESDWYSKAVEELSKKEVLSGLTSDFFRPDEPITREDVADWAYRVASLSLSAMEGKDLPAPFKDVPDDSPASKAINTLAFYNYVKGYPDGEFKPNRPITREETAVLISKIVEAQQRPTQLPLIRFQDMDHFSNWASDSINLLAVNHIVAGYPDGTYRPKQNITRAEFAAMLSNLIRYLKV